MSAEATANLWTAQARCSKTEILAGLCRLREALLLLTTQENTYHDNNPFHFDPSDVFLAVQGASLQGLSLVDDEHGPQQFHVLDQQWMVLEESIRTIATLTKVCVGPAWWIQVNMQRRRRFRKRPSQTSTTPDDHSSINNDNVVTTEESESEEENQQQSSTYTGLAADDAARIGVDVDGMSTRRTLYPPIPDILPAALLRFSANAIEKAHRINSAAAAAAAAAASSESSSTISLEQRMMNLVEAHLLIMLQLCCPSHHSHNHNSSAIGDYDHEAVTSEWNILGAHESLGMVLAYSLKLVCTGRQQVQLQNQQQNLRAFVVTSGRTGKGAIGTAGTSTTTKAISSSSSAHHQNNSVVSKDQWKYILLVARATTELISSGWRPLPSSSRGGTYHSSNDDGQDIVLSLLVVASRGIQLEGLYHQATSQDTFTEARQERLAASLCAAEALSALISLATKSLIPLELQHNVVRTACRLHATLTDTTETSTGTSMESDGLLCPLFDHQRLSNTEEEDQINAQIEDFVHTREQCLNDTTDLHWVMMESETSMEQAVTVLFSLVEETMQAIGDKDSVDSPLFNKLKWNDATEGHFLRDCSSAVQILSSALWGVAPGFSDLSTSLRILWLPAIQSLCQLLSTIHSKVVGTDSTTSTICGTEKSDEGKQQQQLQGVLSYFTKQVGPLVVDAMAAFERVIDNELRGGNGVLSAVDWDAIVGGFDDAIIPWLKIGQQQQREGGMESTSEIRMKAQSVLLRVSQLLQRTTTALLMDYTSLRRLFLLLLHNSEALDERNAELVSLSVFRVWAEHGFFRLEGWVSTASELLNEAFAMGSEGSFKHNSAVRLEALELLTYEEGDSFERVTVSPSRSLSLLVMTRNLQDLYQEIVTENILPVLKLILVNSSSRDNAQSVQSNPTSFDRMAAGDRERGIQSTTDLQSFAVKLTGRLFSDIAGSRRHRSGCVETLLSTARSVASVASVKTEALSQLGLCLAGICVKDLPFVHESIQALVDAIASILVEGVDSILREDHVFENAILASSALGYLGRLQLNANGALAWLAASTPHQRTEPDSVGTLVYLPVCCEPQSDAAEPSVFSFGSATIALLRVISKTQIKGCRDKAASWPLLTKLSALSFDVLNSFLRSGLPVKICGDAQAMLPAAKAGHDEGLFLSTFMCRAKSAQLCFVDHQRSAQNVLSGLTPVGYSGLDNMFTASCRLDDRELAIKSFRYLFSLLPVLMKLLSDGVAKEAYGAMLCRLEAERDSVSATAVHTRLAVSLLTLLTEASLFPITGGRTQKTFEACCYIIAGTAVNGYVLHVALRCAMSTIRTFTSDEMLIARQKFEKLYNKHWCEKLSAGEPSNDALALMVIHEALEQPDVAPDSCNERDEYRYVSKHEELSIEGANAEKFVVAEEGDDAIDNLGSPCAAWLCQNNVILTCRVGAPTSRYRGYVEVILRSPLSFRRGLIPIPGRLALQDLRFPLLLHHGQKPKAGGVQDGNIEFAREGLGQPIVVERFSSSKVLDRANSILERFDTLFSESTASVIAEETRKAVSASPLLANEETLAKKKKEEEELWMAETNSTSTTSTMLSETHSDLPCCNPIAAADLVSAHAESVVDPLTMCVKEWFLSVFSGCEPDCDNQKNRTEKHLRSHDFWISDDDDHLAFKGFKFLDKPGERLMQSQGLERAISILDRAHTTNVYKFGLVYFGSRYGSKELGTLETRLLSTMFCSVAFHDFAAQLGDISPTRFLKHYSAGLDTSTMESDGRYSLSWSSPDSTVVFHVAAMMPPGCNERKKHIGNDLVVILFVDRSAEHDRQLTASSDGVHGAPIVSGHFCHATIVVRPVARPGIYLVSCLIRAGLPRGLDEILSDFAGEDLVAETHVASFVRSLAMRIDVACRTTMDSLAPPTNILERSRLISEMKRYVMDTRISRPEEAIGGVPCCSG